jgi:hypothetical protein
MTPFVMPALVAGIHVLILKTAQDVDGRDNLWEDALRFCPGHDEGMVVT